MGEIDWNAMPEWANFVTWDSDGACWLWAKEPKALLYTWSSLQAAQEAEPRLNKSNPFTAWRESMVRRPVANGLPPVGAHVVVYDDGTLIYGQGESGEVLAHVDGCAVIRMSYGLGCFLPRCLRTPPEQIAADEREKAVAEMMALDQNFPSAMTRADFCRTLYDHGYRKQAKP